MKDENEPLSQRKRIHDLMSRARHIWNNEATPIEFRLTYYTAWCNLKQLLWVDDILRCNVEFFLQLGFTKLVQETLSQREEMDEAIETFEKLLTAYESKQ